MKTRIAWRGVIGWSLILLGGVIGLFLAPWPHTGLTLLALVMYGLGFGLLGLQVAK